MSLTSENGDFPCLGAVTREVLVLNADTVPRNRLQRMFPRSNLRRTVENRISCVILPAIASRGGSR